MVTEIGEITVGTLLKRIREPFTPTMTKGKIYEVVKTEHYEDVIVINDQGKEWAIALEFCKIVGHVDDNIIEELDQMLELCLQYDKHLKRSRRF